MKFRKVLCMIVACLLSVCLLFGCAAPAANNTPVDTDSTTAQTTVTSQTTVTTQTSAPTDEDLLSAYRVPPLEEHIYYNDVRDTVNRTDAEQTAVPYITLLEPYRSGNTAPDAANSIGYVATVLAAQTAVNPYVLFTDITEERFTYKTSSQDGAVFLFDDAMYAGGDYTVDAVTRSVERKDYAFTEEGSRALLSDIAEHAQVNGETIPVAYAVRNSFVNGATMQYSESDACYYAYFIAYNDGQSYILTAYCKSSDNHYIDDVSFEYIHSTYIAGGAAGCSLTMASNTERNLAYKMAWIAACERVLANATSFDSITDGALIPRDEDGNGTVAEYRISGSQTIEDVHMTVRSSHRIRDNRWCESCSSLILRFTK